MQHIIIFLSLMVFSCTLQAQTTLVANNDTAYLYTLAQPQLIDVTNNDEIVFDNPVSYVSIAIMQYPQNGEVFYLFDDLNEYIISVLIYIPYGTSGTDHFTYKLVGHDEAGFVIAESNEADVWIEMASLPISDCIDYCVYPGDTNNDGIVNANDLLYIGLGYGFEGPPRFFSTDIFAPMPSGGNWPFSIGSLNFGFFDCNGDGIVSQEDVNSIAENYDMTHSTPSDTSTSPIPTASGGNFALSVEIENETISIGDTVVANIILTNNGADLSVYGLSFSLFHNAIDSGTTHIQFLDSFIGDSENTLSIQKNRGNGQIEAAITRINHLQAIGSGVFAKVSFVMEDIVEGKTFSNGLTIGFNNITLFAGNSDEIVSLENVALVEDYIDIVLRTETIPATNLKIYPNPCSNLLNINLPHNNNLDKVELFDRAGRLVLSKKIMQGQNYIELDLSLLSPAIYNVNLYSKSKLSLQRSILVK